MRSFSNLLLLVASLLSALTAASRYQETIVVKDGGRFGPVYVAFTHTATHGGTNSSRHGAAPLTPPATAPRSMEGPMFSIGGFVGIVKYTPVLGFSGSARLNVPLRFVTVDLIILFTSSPQRLAMFDDASLAPKISLCDLNGTISNDALVSFGDFNDIKSIKINGGQAFPIDVRTDVRTNGWQHMTFIMCREKSPVSAPADYVANIQLTLDGYVSFRNPYGYLPGLYYGYLPFYGILSTLYFILLFLFSVSACRHRKTMLRMQAGIWFVILMGFIETTTWFLTYQVMNETGGGACCPWRSDLVFAIATNDMKRTVSAVLVLAVALGWGVVEPRLSRRTTLFILVLGFLYLGVSLKYDLIRMQMASRPDASSDAAYAAEQAGDAESILLWALALAVIDVVLIFWIYTAMGTTMRTLTDNHETAKLDMYARLSRTLRMWVVLWIIFTFFDILVRGGLLPWPWSVTFLLTGFWDLLYLGILLTMASIWRPDENSDRYAYSAQLPTDNVLDDFDHEAYEHNEQEAHQMEMEELGVTGSMSASAPKSKQSKREVAVL